MKLPKALVSLTGPVSRESQRVYLKDLKHAFRERIQQQAPPLCSVVNAHLQSVLPPGPTSSSAIRQQYVHLDLSKAVEQAYFDGNLTRPLLYDFIGRAVSLQELETIQLCATKAGIDLLECNNLSARWAARLLHLGHTSKVASIFKLHRTSWLVTPRAHPLLVQFASMAGGIDHAHNVFKEILRLNSKFKSTILVRSLLREAVRHKDLQLALKCIDLDMAATAGQELGLTQWLLNLGRPGPAFNVLRQVHPAMAREAALGLSITRSFLKCGELEEAKRAISWVEGRYVLSVQEDLKALKKELAQHCRHRRPGSSALKEVDGRAGLVST